jgi:hypothetical protein
MANIIDRSRVVFTDLMRDSLEFVRSVYGQAEGVFTQSSAFGQILAVINRISQLNLLYIEDAITELNPITASRRNSIYGIAMQNGYSATRGISARGDILLTQKRSSLNGAASNNKIKLYNYSEIACSNSLRYFVFMFQDYFEIDLPTNTSQIELPIIQGEIIKQTQTADGTPMQSYSFNPPVNRMFENFYSIVKVNGEVWTEKVSLRDMPQDSPNYILQTSRTGNGGVDLIFGNGYYGRIPESGAIIEIQLLVTDGVLGNLPDNTRHTFTFVTPAGDEFGNSVDLNTVFDIQLSSSISFGQNSEDDDVTKHLMNKMSQSSVLATPQNYIAYFEKFRYFSMIDVYPPKESDILQDATAADIQKLSNVLYAYLTVNPNFRKSDTETYFDIPLSAFILNPREQFTIEQTLESSGQKLIGSKLIFVQPTIKRYILNMSISLWKGSDIEVVRTKIKTQLSNYFLNVSRRSKIPKSDITAMLESFSEVDSVNVNFISEDIERELFYLLNDDFRKSSLLKDVVFPENYNSLTMLRKLEFIMSFDEFSNFYYSNLDMFGDIVIGDKEIALLRGGWNDRSGVFHSDTFDPLEPCTVNISFSESTSFNLEDKKLNAIVNQ